VKHHGDDLLNRFAVAAPGNLQKMRLATVNLSGSVSINVLMPRDAKVQGTSLVIARDRLALGLTFQDYVPSICPAVSAINSNPANWAAKFCRCWIT
jgi:hypothetical protein